MSHDGMYHNLQNISKTVYKWVLISLLLIIASILLVAYFPFFKQDNVKQKVAHTFTSSSTMSMSSTSDAIINSQVLAGATTGISYASDTLGIPPMVTPEGFTPFTFWINLYNKYIVSTSTVNTGAQSEDNKEESFWSKFNFFSRPDSPTQPIQPLPPKYYNDPFASNTNTYSNSSSTWQYQQYDYTNQYNSQQYNYDTYNQYQRYDYTNQYNANNKYDYQNKY